MCRAISAKANAITVKRWRLSTKARHIHEVLDMTIEEAREFFDAVPALARKLQTLMDVGLTYIRLGQSATTLSGGEAQRVKLARELSKRGTGQTLYILDEPTTGLHFADIQQLLEVLHQLRDQGNTIVVIEHNLDVIKTADWIVDLGPEGGSGGGEILVSGTPETVADVRSLAHRALPETSVESGLSYLPFIARISGRIRSVLAKCEQGADFIAPCFFRRRPPGG